MLIATGSNDFFLLSSIYYLYINFLFSKYDELKERLFSTEAKLLGLQTGMF